MIESIESIAASGAGILDDIEPRASAAGRTPVMQADFASMVRTGLAQANQALLDSQVDLQKLAGGDIANLHQMMIKLEETRMSFQLLMQVRGRLLEAYQDVMKMQI